MGGMVPLDGILPACRDHIFFVSAFSVLYGFDVDGGLPAVEEGALLFLVVGIEEDELVRVEENGILEGVPAVLLEAAEVGCQYLIIIGPLRLLLPLEAILSNLAHTHTNYILTLMFLIIKNSL